MTERGALLGLRPDQAAWDDVVDRLAAYDITYLTGGSAGQPCPFNYESAWDDVAGHVLQDLRTQARRRGA